MPDELSDASLHTPGRRLPHKEEGEMSNDKTVTRISQIKDDVLILRAEYKASVRDLTHEYKCRGRLVYRTNLRREDNGRVYIYCQFADTNEFTWVNAKNLREKALPIAVQEAA
jgi:hypothetical protein